MTALIAATSASYALAGLVAARLIAGHLAWSWAQDSYEWRREGWRQPTFGVWLGAWCCAALAALVWPLVALAAKFPAERWAVGEERRQIQRRQAERIAELERELEIAE